MEVITVTMVQDMVCMVHGIVVLRGHGIKS
jgi:hypothetical protein